MSQTIFERDKWEEPLSKLSEMTDSQQVHIVLIDKKKMPIDRILFSNALSLEDVIRADTDYQNYILNDLRVINSELVNSGCSVNHDCLFIDEKIEKTAIYNEFLVPYKSERQVLSRVKMSFGTMLLATTREKSQGIYEENELSAINRCLPILSNNIELALDLMAHKIISSTYESILSQNKIGVIFLSKDKKIIEANRLARDLINKKDGLTEKGSKLYVTSSNNQEQFKKLFTDTYENDRPNTVFLRRLEYLSFLKLTLKPIEPAVEDNLLMKNIDYVLFVDKGECKLDLSAVKAEFSLTKAELRLSAYIHSGKSLNCYAEKSALSINTVRWTLKNVFSKTDTNSQSQLLLLLNQFKE